MLKTKSSIVLLIALVMATPAGLATWYSYGEAEPNYPADVTEKFMLQHPPTAGLPVYFNVVLTEFLDFANPSLAALESRYHYQADFVTSKAYLGVWRDCNRDGYIGTAETAQTEYPATELRALEIAQEFTSPCESGSLFNDSGWIYEFIWIYDGAERNSTGQLSRFINDTDVRIWGDSSLPGAALAGDCYINPATGFFSSTGAMIDYADCLAGRAIVTNINAADDATGRSTGIGFRNAGSPDNPQCSDSILNRNETHLWSDAAECTGPTDKKSGTGLYEENSRDPAFSTWDCKQPPTRAEQGIKDPTPGGDVPEEVINPSTNQPIRLADADGNFAKIRQVPAPAVQSLNPRGSYYDGLNETLERCDGTPQRGNLTTGVHAANVGLGSVYVDPEAEVEQSTNKVTNDDTFTFYPGAVSRHNREGQVCNGNFRLLEENQATTFAFDNSTQSHQWNYCTATRQKDMPQYLGLNKGMGILQTNYFGRVGTLRGVDNFATTRDGNVVAGVPEYWSFYADVGTGTTGAGATLPGGAGLYGKEWCGTSTTGVVGGFDCDKTHWWNTAYGGTAMPKDANGKDRGAYPGDTYDLRDIDCYDGSLASRIAPGVGLGTTPLGPDGACANVA